METGIERRCIGLDVHREFAQVAIWQGGLVIQAGRFATTPQGVRAFAEGLGPGDEVALEATGNTWAIATLLASRAGRVVVSNPAKTRAIAEAKVKTDKVDAEILAQLLAADYLPRGVAAGPGHGRVAPPGAAAGAHRAPAHPVEEPGARDLAPQPGAALPGRGPVRAQGPPLAGRPGPAPGRAAAAVALLRQLDFHAEELRLVDTDLGQVGVGPAGGVAVDDRARDRRDGGVVDRGRGRGLHPLPHPEKLVAYLGLNPRVRQSGGQPASHGRITKAGSAHARGMLVEAAWSASKAPGPLRAFY